MTLKCALLATTATMAFAGVPPTAADVAQAREARNRNQATHDKDPMLERASDLARTIDHWDKVDTVLDGIDAMRAEGERYLPRFGDEDSVDYQARLKMTRMTNIYQDIIEGLASKPFGREVQLHGEEQPDWVTDFIVDVDGSGSNLTVFAANTFFNGINNACDWILIDYEDTGNQKISVEEAKRRGLRPFWSHILARNVLEIRSKVIGGEETLTYVRLYEPGEVDHVRVFQRGDNSGEITWALYEDSETQVEPGETRFVEIKKGTMRGVDKIPLVPFTSGRRDGRTWYFHPPLKNAVDLQVELYQQESGLKFAKNLTAYPMLTANGMKPPKDSEGNPQYKIAVGPNRVLWSSAGDDGRLGEWRYLEPNSESLKFLADDIKETKQDLRELGRQPLTAQSGNITVITAAVASGKAKSSVKAWALNLRVALQHALEFTGQFYGADEYTASVDVFVEFDDYVDGDDLEALHQARERGDISQETYLEELKRRDVLSSNHTMERETKRLLSETPGDDEEEVTEG